MGISSNSGIRTLGGPATTFTTTFSGTENPISQGGIWLTGLTDGVAWNDLQTTPGKVFASAFDTDGVTDGIAQLKRSFLACNSKQFSQGTCFTTYTGSGASGTHEIEVFSNLTITPSSITGYECYVNLSANHTLVRWNGAHNDFTPLASNNISTFTAPVEGDVIRIENDGTGLLSCFQNGVLRTQFFDDTFLDGNPGIGNNPTTGGIGITLSGTGWKSWTCGNF